jgi:hypothetical protein
MSITDQARAAEFHTRTVFSHKLGLAD